MNYLTNPDTPGFIMMPTDTKSRRFRPDGTFGLIISGPVSATPNETLIVWGIPTPILEDTTITDKAPYWFQLARGYSLSDSNESAAFYGVTGLTVEVRASAAVTCYVMWSYAPSPVWDAAKGGL